MNLAVMDVNTAKAKYPAAWRIIESGVAEVRAASNAYVAPFVAHVVVLNGIETLEVIASTDLVLDGAGDEPLNMTFLAPTVPPLPMLSLVPSTGGSEKDSRRTP